jgi:hypothetical protein
VLGGVCYLVIIILFKSRLVRSFDNYWFRSMCKGCESSHQLRAARDEWMSALHTEIRICHSWYCIPNMSRDLNLNEYLDKCII